MKKFVGTKEISVIAECGSSKAREIKKEVNDRLKKKGIKVINDRKAPLKEVLTYIGYPEEYARMIEESVKFELPSVER